MSSSIHQTHLNRRSGFDFLVVVVSYQKLKTTDINSKGLWQ